MLKKHKNLLGLSLQNLLKFKTRTIVILTSLTITISFVSCIAFVKGGLEREAALSAEFAPDITVQSLQAGRQTLVPMAWIDKISAIDGVEKVNPRIWGYLEQDGNIYTCMGLDIYNTTIPPELQLSISQGRFLETDDRNKCVVGTLFANVFNASVGKTLQLSSSSEGKWYNFTVIGIFSIAVTLYTADLIITDVESARNFFAISDEYSTDLAVYVQSDALTSEVAKEIDNMQNIDQDIRVLTRESIKDALITAYGARSGFATLMWYIVLISVILISWNQSTAVSHETKREVGLLKALGFSTSDILEIRITESLLLGLLGATIGIFIGILYDVFLGAPIITEFLIGWASEYPSITPPIYVGIETLLFLYLICIFPLVIGTFIPSWKNSVTEPMEVLKRG